MIVARHQVHVHLLDLATVGIARDRRMGFHQGWAIAAARPPDPREPRRR
jgi:hypothetical protein